MLYIKAFHLICMVAWFAGLFYLPRLFVYHSQTNDRVSINRFKIMERRLYYGITWPAGIATTLLGCWLLGLNLSYYLHAGWMHGKLTLVIGLWIYHWCSGAFVKQFARDTNTHSTQFFRIFNEIPTVFLIAIILLVVVKP
jgi:putative membrane protein